MFNNFTNINKNIRIFSQKIVDTDNKCTVLVELRDQANVAYRLKVPRGKIVGEKFHAYLENQLNEYDMNLTKEDVTKIEDIIKSELDNPAVIYNSKPPLEELLMKMYQIAYGLAVWFESDMFVDKGYFYIKAETKAVLQRIINDFDSEWTQLEFKRELKFHDLLITDKHQPYVRSVYSVGGANLTSGAAYKYLMIPVNKMKEFCESMGVEISDGTENAEKEDIA